MMTEDEIQRSPLPKKAEGEFLRCPICSHKAWHIGRSSATCASCDYPVELDQGVDFERIERDRPVETEGAGDA